MPLPLSDPYPQYILKNTGVSGGLTLFGGINSSENLILQSTSNSTKGLILLAPTGFGNVGIGTTTPNLTSKLHVVGGPLRLTQPAAGTSFISESVDPGVASNFNIRHDSLSGFTKIFNSLGNNNTSGISFLEEDGLTNILTITNAGNVGIGAGSALPPGPAAKLDIASSANILPTNLIGSTFTSYIQPNMASLSTSSAVAARANNAAANTFSLGVLSQKPSSVNFRGLTSITYMSDGIATDQGFSIDQFHPTNAATYERFRIDSAGNVGIGTVSPTAKLNAVAAINGFSASFSGGNAAGIYPVLNSGITHGQNFSGGMAEENIWNTLSPITYPSTGIRFLQQTSAGSHLDLMFLSNTGNVGIGTTAPSQKLHVVGNLRVQGSTDCTLGNGSGATNCTSDIRLKNNVTPIANALDKISQIVGVEFDWNSKSLAPGKHSIGVIAQDVKKVFPTAVVENANGYLAVDYAVLVSPLIQATKDLYTKYVLPLFLSDKKQNRDIAKLKAENLQMKAWICEKDSTAPFCGK